MVSDNKTDKTEICNFDMTRSFITKMKRKNTKKNI